MLALLVACGGDLPTPDARPSDVGVDPDKDIGTDTILLDAGVEDAIVLRCDDGFGVPVNITNQSFEVTYTDAQGWTDVAMRVSGPGAPVAMFESVDGNNGSGPFVWTYRIAGAQPGQLDLFFSAQNGDRELGQCSILIGGQVEDGGMPDVTPDATMPSDNRFGIGLVSPGNSEQMRLTADLTGSGGYVKMIFAGVVPGMQSAQQDWKDALNAAYGEGLVPVIRFAPPWGDRRVRNQSDGGNGTSFSNLGSSYAAIVRDLPKRDGVPIYVEVHNEPNLCTEWSCDPGATTDGWISDVQMAREYAALLRDVAIALHGLGDSRVKVVNGGLAPGGVKRCKCVGARDVEDGEWEAGNTGLDFLEDMIAAVPDIFTQIDAFATHSYPASNIGYGFFTPYAESRPGLLYFENELVTIARPDIGVLITETGWTTAGGSRMQLADWTVAAYRDPWLTHPNIVAVMPFILQDSNWDAFAWVSTNGNPYPVYDAVRRLRCETRADRCP